MNKLKYSLIALATLFVACDNDDYTDWAAPQSNEPEELASASFSATEVSTIVMADLTADDVQIFVPSTVIEDGATDVNYKVVLSADDNSVEIAASEDGYVSVSDLQSAVETLYGKAPETRGITTTIYCYFTLNGTVYRCTGSANITVSVLLDAPFISTGYYLIGDFNGWSEETMIPFTHSDEDVYADPIFTVSFTTSAAGQFWKIIPQSNVDAGNIWIEGETGIVGVAEDGDTSLSGYLVAVGGVGAGKIAEEGEYTMTINMLEYTYTIKMKASEYYMTGNPNSWTEDGNFYSSLFYPVEGNIFDLTTYYAGTWDLKIWGVDDVGDWDNIYGCPADKDGVGDESGTIVYSNGDQSTIGCITAPSAGYYTLTIDMSEMTYEWTVLENQNPTEYNLVSITGDFNGWDDYVDMKQVASHNWYVETEIATEGGLKFLVDHEWTVKWGASMTISSDDFYGTGVTDGTNITVPAGTYRIYLNDITGQFAFIATE